VGLLAGAALMALLILTSAFPSLDPSYAAVTPPSMRPAPSNQADIGYAIGLLWNRAAPYALELLLTGLCAGLYWLATTAGRRCGKVQVAASEGLQRRRSLRLGGTGRLAGWDRWRRAVLPAVVAVCVTVVGVYWLGYDAQAVGPRAAVDVGDMPAVGQFVDARSPANATVLVVGGEALARGEALDRRDGRVQLMFWAHRDVYLLGSGGAAAVCPLARRGARVGSPVVVLAAPGRSVPAAGAALAQRGDGWTLYAPACG
jgi:hypothetical protein